MHSALVEQEVPGWAAALVVTSPTRAVVADSETRLVAVMSTVVASVVKSMPEVVRVTEVTKDVGSGCVRCGWDSYCRSGRGTQTARTGSCTGDRKSGNKASN